MIFRGR